MGRKNPSKGKEKRQKRKEEQYKIKLAMEAVDKANKLVDPLEPFAVFRKFTNSEVTANFTTTRVNELNDETKMWIFDLTRHNMRKKYEQCSWGWSDTKKYLEMMDERAWYLIARSEEGSLLGFSHFRFDLDEGIEVLYCYELQLEVPIQRKGLGKFMMQILELIAFTNNLKKVILTVLKNNSATLFFKTLNYQLDESSPIDNEEEYFPYEILSKVNKKLVPAASNVVNGNCSSHSSHCCPGH